MARDVQYYTIKLVVKRTQIVENIINPQFLTRFLIAESIINSFKIMIKTATLLKTRFNLKSKRRHKRDVIFGQQSCNRKHQLHKRQIGGGLFERKTKGQEQ